MDFNVNSKTLERCKRKPVWGSLFGSWNYGLNTEGSDMDIRIYVHPTFDDLYEKKMYTEKICEKDKDDYDFHDIRRLPSLFFKGNTTWIESLFSDYQITYDEGANKILAMRDEISVMNIPKMYMSTLNHVEKKINLVRKGHGTATTQPMVDKVGYDTKEMLHAMRMVDLLEKFQANGFKDFEKCLKYTGQERETMLEYRSGKYSKEEALDLMKKKHADLKGMKDLFIHVEPNLDTLEKLENIVREIVRKEMIGWAL